MTFVSGRPIYFLIVPHAIIASNLTVVVIMAPLLQETALVEFIKRDHTRMDKQLGTRTGNSREGDSFAKFKISEFVNLSHKSANQAIT